MKRGIERSLRDLNGVSRHLPEALGDRIAVQRFQGEDCQQQQIQDPLGEVRLTRARHDGDTSCFDISPQQRVEGQGIGRPRLIWHE
jgi:hypothetical protein